MATAKLYLDTRRAGANTEKTVKLRISINHRKSTGYITLNIPLLLSQWDKENSRVIDHPQKAMLNAKIAKTLGDTTAILFQLSQTENLDEWTNSELCQRIKEELGLEKKKEQAPVKQENPNSVVKFFERYKEYKELADRTAEMYDVTWRRIEAWLGVEKASALQFSDINMTWIEDFDKFMSQTAPSPNGRRMHHANLKAVINYAIDHEVLDRNPYRRYKIKTAPTKKRNMDVEVLRTIITTQNLEPWMEKYRDFFVLSFMLRGLNTIDLCHLTKPVNGRVDWVRTKTKQPLSLKIEPEMQQLIDKYAGTELMLMFAENRPYRYFNDKLTKALHKICAHINNHRRKGEIEIPDFTMYWARHSWATIAAKLDISDGTIGLGLAHSSKSVTDIYIERDPEKIDIANRRVLDYVLYDKDYRLPEPAMKKRGRPRKNATQVKAAG